MEKPKTREVDRSSETGRFVSDEYAEANSGTTYTDTVPSGEAEEGVKAQVLDLLEMLENGGFELEAVEVGDDVTSSPGRKFMTLKCVVPVELTFAKPDVVLDGELIDESGR